MTMDELGYQEPLRIKPNTYFLLMNNENEWLEILNKFKKYQGFIIFLIRVSF